MSYQGGDMIEITANHDTIGSYTFSIPSEEDATVDLGGIKSEITVAGDGSSIDTMTRKPWKFEVPVCWDVLDVNTLDILQRMQESPVHTDFTFTNISGAIFAGKGKPVGDLTGSMKDSKISATFTGGGRLAKI